MLQLITYCTEQAELVCQGDWTIDKITALERVIDALLIKVDNAVTINGQGITKMDSAGGMVLLQLQNRLHELGKSAVVQSLHHDFQALLTLIEARSKSDQLAPKKITNKSFPAMLGKIVIKKLNECLNFIAFLGQFAVIFVKSLRRFHVIKWRSVFSVIDSAGFQALPIVALLTFLVGVVMTYQIALQLSTYGANIYIVDVTGIIVFREFAPLITAIIAAGRTSTSFAAQIGTMKVNEEIDALQTMGVPVFVRVVLPKVFGLLIALPLLVVWSNVFGVLGTMVMSKSQLGISYQTFLMRFEHVIAVQQYLIGLIKVPFFALVIALVGSYQGFQVAHNADSVGKKTTKSAVQSIFLIIIVDALFSVIFSIRGI